MTQPFLLDHPLWLRLALTLVHFLWQGCLVAVLLWLSIKLMRVRRSEARYALCLAAMAVIVLCPLVTFLVVKAPSQPHRETHAPRSAVGPLNTAAKAPLPGVTDAAQSQRAASRPSSTSPAIVIRAATGQAGPFIILAWLAGVCLLSIRLAMSYRGVRRLQQRLAPLPQRIVSRARRLAEQLGFQNLPAIYCSDTVREAMGVGFFRPMVLIPLSWLTHLSPDMLDAALPHELAHIRRWDVWINLVQRLVETLLFYHPAVWWLSQRIRTERELCCDALAVQATRDPLLYAKTLEFVALRRQARTEPALCAALGGSKMALLKRIRNVLNRTPGSGRSAWWPAGLFALLVPAAFWLVAVSLSPAVQADSPTAEQEAPTTISSSETQVPDGEGAREGEGEGKREGERAERRRDGDREREGDGEREQARRRIKFVSERAAALYKKSQALFKEGNRKEAAKLRAEAVRLERAARAKAKRAEGEGRERESREQPRDVLREGGDFVSEEAYALFRRARALEKEAAQLKAKARRLELAAREKRGRREGGETRPRREGERERELRRDRDEGKREVRRDRDEGEREVRRDREEARSRRDRDENEEGKERARRQDRDNKDEGEKGEGGEEDGEADKGESEEEGDK